VQLQLHSRSCEVRGIRQRNEERKRVVMREEEE
jgi:hypothetical protein